MPITSLHVPDEYPIKELAPADFEDIVRYTETNGISARIEVRPREDGGGYEITDGVRRYRGALENGYTQLDVIVKHTDRDTAIYDMCRALVEERPRLLISEKARAYSEMLKITDSRGERTDLTYSRTGNKLPKSHEMLAQSLGISKTTLYRIACHVKLIPPLLEQCDLKSISLEGGEHLANISPEQQTWVAYVMEKDFRVPTTDQAARIHKLSMGGKLTEMLVDEIMNEEVEELTTQLTLNRGFLSKYKYFADKTPREIEDIIDTALAEYFSRIHNRQITGRDEH